MPDSDFDTILKSLERQYPGRFMVGVSEVAQIFNVSPKTIYNGTHRKTQKRFPVQPAKGVPGKHFKLVDIARVLAKI